MVHVDGRTVNTSFSSIAVFLKGAGGEVQTYQIRTAPTSGSLSQTVVMTPPMGLSHKSDDPTMKREIRLAKNR